jgi:hypothetical protein
MLESTLISLGFYKDYMIDDENGEICCPHYFLNFPDFFLQGLPNQDDPNSWFVVSSFCSYLKIEFDDELIQLVHLFRKNCRTED